MNAPRIVPRRTTPAGLLSWARLGTSSTDQRAEPRRSDARVPLGLFGMALLAWWARRETRRRRAAEAMRTRLVGELFDAAEQERRRLARDLHDDVCQELAMLSLDAFHAGTLLSDRDGRVAAALAGLEQRAAAAAETIRRLSHDLHPATLSHVGLVDAIRAHCADIERRHHARVRVELGGDLPLLGGGPATVSLYRIFQEAVRNALTHGAARTIVVSLSLHRSELRLAVMDDGLGFDGKTCAPGLGLISMRERASLLGGAALITSHPGEGTAVRVTVPCSALVDGGTHGHPTASRHDTRSSPGVQHVVPR